MISIRQNKLQYFQYKPNHWKLIGLNKNDEWQFIWFRYELGNMEPYRLPYLRLHSLLNIRQRKTRLTSTVLQGHPSLSPSTTLMGAARSTPSTSAMSWGRLTPTPFWPPSRSSEAQRRRARSRLQCVLFCHFTFSLSTQFCYSSTRPCTYTYPIPFLIMLHRNQNFHCKYPFSYHFYWLRI